MVDLDDRLAGLGDEISQLMDSYNVARACETILEVIATVGYQPSRSIFSAIFHTNTGSD